MAYCRKCGQKIEESFKICPMCGAVQNNGSNEKYDQDENKESKSSSDNVNIFCLFSFLCGLVLLFIPVINRSLILIVGAVGVGLGLTAMIKKKPAASAFQNYVLPIISIFMCIGVIIFSESKWHTLTSLFK